MRVVLLFLCILVAGVAQAQTPDPVARLGDHWRASETLHVDLAESVQKLVQAYTDLQKHEADVAAYWKAYVAGLGQ